MTAAKQDYRAARALKLEMALALIGKPREVCPACKRPMGGAAYVEATHTPRSAALAMDLDPQAVYRAVRKRERSDD